MPALTLAIQDLSRQLFTEATSADTLDDLRPLARRIAHLQRVSVAEVPAGMKAFRRSIEGPIEEVERTVRDGFQYPPQFFGSLWETGELADDPASELCRRRALTIENGHMLLNVACGRLRGERVIAATFERYADELVSAVLRAAAARVGEEAALGLAAHVAAM